MASKILVTGSAGFIGFHLTSLLLQEGCEVLGLDGFTDYYDVDLKEKRNQMLRQNSGFHEARCMLEDANRVLSLATEFQPEVIIHLAAQAGVRHSLENPRAYIDSNIVGTFNIMEAAKTLKVNHLMMASTSSVYGANTETPFSETDKADRPLTLYAATKKASEGMAHSYSHLWKIPTTMFRFFTVYGPWGRPDLALYKFVDAIMDGRPIDVYNHGEMYRDFTYVDDVVRSIILLMSAVPEEPKDPSEIPPGDTLSTVAPFRVVNVGNSEKVRLMDFIAAIEETLGRTATKNFMDMQKGDVPATWADASLLQRLTRYKPETDIQEGVQRFVRWYLDYKKA
ncbi:GDP-mannose 4,6-dehydratase [Alphaproteobacteria bacterium]|nr:GDP-mannose 4,6-dehydratase [Alphaproteobacteria bacterium]